MIQRRGTESRCRAPKVSPISSTPRRTARASCPHPWRNEFGLWPVVCLPGLTRNSRDFHELALQLSTRAKRKVIAFDYRGRGQSAYDPEITNYNVGARGRVPRADGGGGDATAGIAASGGPPRKRARRVCMPLRGPVANRPRRRRLHDRGDRCRLCDGAAARGREAGRGRMPCTRRALTARNEGRNNEE